MPPDLTPGRWAARLDPRGAMASPGLWASSTADGRSSPRSERRRAPPESWGYDRTSNLRGRRQPWMHLCDWGDIHATREADTVTTRDRGGRPERVPRTSRYRTPCVLSRPRLALVSAISRGVASRFERDDGSAGHSTYPAMVTWTPAAKPPPPVLRFVVGQHWRSRISALTMRPNDQSARHAPPVGGAEPGASAHGTKSLKRRHQLSPLRGGEARQSPFEHFRGHDIAAARTPVHRVRGRVGDVLDDGRGLLADWAPAEDRRPFGFG